MKHNKIIGIMVILLNLTLWSYSCTQPNAPATPCPTAMPDPRLSILETRVVELDDWDIGNCPFIRIQTDV